MITASTTLKEVSALPEFANFSNYVMVCRPETWAKMSGRPIVPPGTEATNPYAAERTVRGIERIRALINSGRQVAFDLWDDQETSADPTRANTKLFFFPGKPGAPFVLVIAGGGYQSVCNSMEGFPAAVELNDLGYNAFVLSYRVRTSSNTERALDDVAQAIAYIDKHREHFDVAPDYAVMGFSAGAHLTAEWGTDNLGFSSRKARTPNALFLCYAPIDLHTVETAEDQRFLNTVCSNRIHERIDTYCVNKHVWDGYPPTYLWHCKDDNVVPFENYKIMRAALDAVGVENSGHTFDKGGHALLGPHAPEADHWMEMITPSLLEWLPLQI